jgi:two-component system response regulator YesN
METPLVRKGLKSLIDRVEGFITVHCLGDGEQAVIACAVSPVDMAFLSLAMPRLSGLETAKRINALYPGTPVIFTGVRQSLDFTQEASYIAIDGYIAKPVSPAMVKEILERHKALHVFGLPENVRTLEAHIAEKNFPAACAAIPAVAASIRAQAGEKAEYWRDILTRVNFRILRFLDACGESGKGPAPLSLPETEDLVPDLGLDLALFRSAEEMLRRNCEMGHPLMGKVFKFIDGNTASGIGLGDIVNHSAASQTHISRIFKKYFGMSVMDYLHMRKIHLAKEFFVYANKNSSKAAHLLGYNEAGYFSKVFKKYAGVIVQQFKAGLWNQADKGTRGHG